MKKLPYFNIKALKNNLVVGIEGHCCSFDIYKISGLKTSVFLVNEVEYERSPFYFNVYNNLFDALMFEFQTSRFITSNMPPWLYYEPYFIHAEVFPTIYKAILKIEKNAFLFEQKEMERIYFWKKYYEYYNGFFVKRCARTKNFSI